MVDLNKFLQLCHLHDESIRIWCEKKPFSFILATLILGCTMAAMFKFVTILSMIIFGVFTMYSMMVMVGANIYKQKIGWYKTHRCPECGTFIQPRKLDNDQ